MSGQDRKDKAIAILKEVLVDIERMPTLPMRGHTMLINQDMFEVMRLLADMADARENGT